MKNIKLIFPDTEECWGEVIDYYVDNGIYWVEVEYDLPGTETGTSTICVNWTEKVGYCTNIVLNRLYEIEI